MKKILLLLCVLMTGISSALATDPPAASTPTSTDSNPNSTPGVIYLGLKDDLEISWIAGFPPNAIFSTMELPYFDDGRLKYAIEHGAQMKYCTNYDFASRNMKFSVTGVGSTPAENVYFPYSGSASGMITPADGKSKYDLPTSTQTITMYFVIDGSSINRSDGAHAPDYCNTYVLPWKIKFRPYLYSNTLAWSGTKDYVGYEGDVLDLTMKPGLSGSVLSGNNTITDIGTGNDLGNSKMAGTDAPTPSITYNTNGVKIYTAGSYSVGFSQAASAERDYPQSGGSEYVHYQYYNRINHNGSLVKTISNKTANVGDVVTVGGTEEFGTSSPTISVTGGSSSDYAISGQNVKFDKAGTYTVTVTTHGDMGGSPTSSSLFYRPKSYSYTVTVTDTKEDCDFTVSETTFYVPYSQLLNGGINLKDYITVHSDASLSFTDGSSGGGATIGMSIGASTGIVSMYSRPKEKYDSPGGPKTSDAKAYVFVSCPATATHKALPDPQTMYVYPVKDDSDLAPKAATKIVTLSEITGGTFKPGDFWQGDLATWVKENHGGSGGVSYYPTKGGATAAINSPGEYVITFHQPEVYTVKEGTASYTLTVLPDEVACDLALTKTSDTKDYLAVKSGINLKDYIETCHNTSGVTFSITEGAGTYQINSDGVLKIRTTATELADVKVKFTCPAIAGSYEAGEEELTINVVKSPNRLSRMSDNYPATSGVDWNIASKLNNVADGTCHYSWVDSEGTTHTTQTFNQTKHGTYTVSATQDEGNFFLGTTSPVSYNLTIDPVDESATVSATNITASVTATTGGYILNGSNITRNSTGGITYSKNTSTDPITISGNTFTCSVPGTYTIKYSIAGDDIYKATSGKTFQFTVTPISGTLTIDNVTKKVSEISGGYTLEASKINTPSTGAITYTCSNAAMAISGNKFTCSTAGTYTITATQAAAGAYESMTTTFTITVVKDDSDAKVNPSSEPDITSSVTSDPTNQVFNITKTVDQVKSGYSIAALCNNASGVTYTLTSNANGKGALTTAGVFSATEKGSYQVKAHKDATATQNEYTATFNITVVPNDDSSDPVQGNPSYADPSDPTNPNKVYVEKTIDQVKDANYLDLASLLTGSHKDGIAYAFTSNPGSKGSLTSVTRFQASEVGTYVISATRGTEVYSPAVNVQITVKVNPLSDVIPTYPDVDLSKEQIVKLSVAKTTGFNLSTLFVNPVEGTITTSAAGATASCVGGVFKTDKVGHYVVSASDGVHTNATVKIAVIDEDDDSKKTTVTPPTAPNNGVEPGEDIGDIIDITPNGNDEDITVIIRQIAPTTGTPIAIPYDPTGTPKGKVPDTATPGKYQGKVQQPDDPENLIPGISTDPFEFYVTAPTQSLTVADKTINQGENADLTSVLAWSGTGVKNNTTPKFYIKQSGSWVPCTSTSSLAIGAYDMKVEMDVDPTNYAEAQSKTFKLTVADPSKTPTLDDSVSDEVLSVGDDPTDPCFDPKGNTQSGVVKLKKVPGGEEISFPYDPNSDPNSEIPSTVGPGVYDMTIIIPDDPDNGAKGGEFGPKRIFIEDPTKTKPTVTSPADDTYEPGDDPTDGALNKGDNAMTPHVTIQEYDPKSSSVVGPVIDITGTPDPKIPEDVTPGRYKVTVEIPDDTDNLVKGVGPVTYEITVLSVDDRGTKPSGSSMTVCLPEYSNISDELKDPAKAVWYQIKGKISGDNPKYLILESVSASELQAGHAYLLHAVTSLNAKFSCDYNSSESKSVQDSNGLVGTYTSMTAPTGSFVISGNKFYKVNSTVSVAGGRCYINMAAVPELGNDFKVEGGALVPLNGGSPANLMLLSLSFDDLDATGVENVDTEAAVKEPVIYNLQGVRVGKNYKGIVIINGKKRVQK